MGITADSVDVVALGARPPVVTAGAAKEDPGLFGPVRIGAREPELGRATGFVERRLLPRATCILGPGGGRNRAAQRVEGILVGAFGPRTTGHARGTSTDAISRRVQARCLLGRALASRAVQARAAIGVGGAGAAQGRASRYGLADEGAVADGSAFAAGTTGAGGSGAVLALAQAGGHALSAGAVGRVSRTGGLIDPRACRVARLRGIPGRAATLHDFLDCGILVRGFALILTRSVPSRRCAQGL